MYIVHVRPVIANITVIAKITVLGVLNISESVPLGSSTSQRALVSVVADDIDVVGHVERVGEDDEEITCDLGEYLHSTKV